MQTFDFKRALPQAFPKLDATQIAAIAGYAECKTYMDGDVLFRAGETDFKFHVIKSGAIAIIDRSSGEPHTLLMHEPGEFTGDMTNLVGRASNVDAIAQGETEVYALSEENLRHIIGERPGLSDLILQTFVMRVRALRESQSYTGLRVIGSKFSRDTFRIRDFLSRNHVLYTYFDLDEDPEFGELLKKFGLKESDTPVVGVFSFIGATPRTAWLPPEIEKDAKGFIKTGAHGRRISPMATQPPAVFSGNQPPRSFRRGGRAV
jgi:thioredoxin reductase (NADPH)